MWLWTYRRAFAFAGRSFLVETKVDLKRMQSRLFEDGRLLAEDRTKHWSPEGLTRWHQLRSHCAGLGFVAVEAGFVSVWSIGIRVTLDDRLIHESHPGSGFLKLSSADPGTLERQFDQRAAEAQVAKERWQRNRYCVITDVSLALFFFVVAKLTDQLQTAALATALAGIGVAVVQRFVKVDLLGGLAAFGVCMLLFSAGFSALFQDDFIVRMKSTFLGLLVATLMSGDFFFNRCQYFGPRFARYLPVSVDERRLTLGMAGLGATMAALNHVVVMFFPGEIWLYYTTFGDLAVSLVLMLAIVRFARVRAEDTHATAD